MATIGGKPVREVAKARLAALKAAEKPKGQLLNAILSPDARQIKTRQGYERMPEGDVRRGKKGKD